MHPNAKRQASQTTNKKESTKKYLKKKYHLSAKEFSVIRDIFKSVDKDKNRRISLDELRTLLTQLNKFPDLDDLKEFFEKIDKNKDGKINFEEFIKLLVEEELGLDEDPFLLDAFCFFDLNGDGLITRSEFKKAMDCLGERWTYTEIDDLICLSGMKFNI